MVRGGGGGGGEGERERERGSGEGCRDGEGEGRGQEEQGATIDVCIPHSPLVWVWVWSSSMCSGPIYRCVLEPNPGSPHLAHVWPQTAPELKSLLQYILTERLGTGLLGLTCTRGGWGLGCLD